MVHFGRFLNSEQSRCSWDSYIGYKVLKKHVKKLCAASHAHDDGDLLCEADPASNGDFETCVAFPGAVAQQGKEEFVLLFREEIGKLNHFVIQAKSEAQTVVDLEELAIFAETNRVACRKIVKKFEKKCGPVPELQQQLQRLDDEPFLASLSRELPQARIALQIRLSSAGVCEEGPHNELRQIGTQSEDVFPAGSDAIQIAMEELDPSPSSPGTSSGSVRNLLVNLLWPQPVQERYAFLVFLSCGILLLGTSAVLRFVPAVRDSTASMLCGAGLLMMFLGVITRIGTSFRVIESLTERGPAFRHCIWQQLRYSDLCDRDFAPNFVVTKLSREEDGRAVSRILDEVPYVPPQLLGAAAARVWPSSCGCCLQDFEPLDEVTLLPCHHIFCSDCISAWALAPAKGAHSCPMCRADFSNMNIHQTA